MVIVAVVAILVALAVSGSQRYRAQFGFSSQVRELTHAITLARMRAMQSQTTSRLLIRPLQGADYPYWLYATAYNLGDVVQYARFQYRCTTAHVSDANATVLVNEPAVGASWNTYWEIIADYQYNTLLVDVQACAASLAGLFPCNGDPTPCVWVDANTYTAANPTVSIQFNWLGIPVGPNGAPNAVDYNLVLQGAEDATAAPPAANNRVGCVTLSVSSLGRIKHQQSGEQ